MILRVDVTDYDSLAREAKSVYTAALHIRSVVNVAALPIDAAFANMTLDSWHGVVGAKVQGSLNWHHLLSAEPLDFFIMTTHGSDLRLSPTPSGVAVGESKAGLPTGSSIASAIASTSQKNYSAANAALDTLIVHHRYRGLPSISVILPAIVGVGQ